jgi:uncharacterized protein (TIGR02452 family)
MSKRSARAGIAAETVRILEQGCYRLPSGEEIAVGNAVARSCEQSYLVRPEDTSALVVRADKKLASRSFATLFEVCNETTLHAAHRLVQRYGSDHVAALNFASAKNPGGGFLGGSQAQEESLARASGLYATLLRHPAYYEVNRRAESLLYTDQMIVSPRVPVFRDDEDVLLSQPWEVTMLTSPAPNAGALRTNDPASLPMVEPTFRRRIEQILSAAIDAGQTALVLGAWGCGVFGNDPRVVARLFAEQLCGQGRFARGFAQVVFAILDRGGETISAFREVFGESA